jgi:hypothetical protein
LRAQVRSEPAGNAVFSYIYLPGNSLDFGTYTVLAIMLRKMSKLDGAGNTDFSIEDCIEQALQPVIPQAQEKGIDLI